MNPQPAPQFTLGATALYAQLASLLRSQILSGEWPFGEEIPSLQELVDLYGLGRVTVRQSVQILVDEGLLSSQRGRRTFVTYAPNDPQEPLAGKPLFTSVASSLHQSPHYGVALLSQSRVDKLPPARWQVGREEGPYICTRKLDQIDGVPYGLSVVHVAEDLHERFPKGAEQTEKLVQLVRQHANSVKIAQERLTVMPMDFEAAAALGYPMASPAARAERVLCDASERVIYFAVTIYRGDRFGLDRDLSEFFRDEMPAGCNT
ncbi:GntR family transcriptional regulator [Ottowia thiooxydans]|uniref:GntR family transcriptional regulator n=1 Tax=Ottowia thiooxydans TaxID=219182 RepID=UPI00040CF859|nr:GntR family transcriptional regulator [Ottowia thiooxydans]